MDPLWRPYLLAQLPGWAAAALAVWVLYRFHVLPGWAAAGLAAVWVLKDLLLFPRMRRFYRSEPAAGRIIGTPGVAVTDLAPTGFVRVHGELWQARADRRVPSGGRVRVNGIDGLVLQVGPDEGDS
jgi:membrane protein implicated in regulation of membrane protease activity